MVACRVRGGGEAAGDVRQDVKHKLRKTQVLATASFYLTSDIGPANFNCHAYPADESFAISARTRAQRAPMKYTGFGGRGQGVRDD